MRILGIDPGSAATGYGVVERREGRLVHAAHGTVRPPGGASLASRLAHLYGTVGDVIAHHAPDCVVVEQVFVAASPRSALVLGQARGAILASLGEARVRVSELAARQVKKAVTGTGAADKKQMQLMVSRLLNLDSAPPTDAADALALALTLAQAGPLADLPIRGRRRSSRRRTTQFVLGRTR